MWNNMVRERRKCGDNEKQNKKKEGFGMEKRRK